MKSIINEVKKATSTTSIRAAHQTVGSGASMRTAAGIDRTGILVSSQFPGSETLLDRLACDSEYIFFAERLTNGHVEDYEPQIFFAPPGMPASISLRYITEDIKYDVKSLRQILLSMMVEKCKLDKTGIQSSLLKPTNFLDSNLLSFLRNTVPAEFNQIRGIIIDKEEVIVSLKNVIDFAKIEHLIQSNYIGYIFNVQEETRQSGAKLLHFSESGQQYFSVTSQMIRFPYKEMVKQGADGFELALKIFVELIARIHHDRPYYEGAEIYYHKFLPIIKELIGDNFRSNVLGDLVEAIVKAYEDGSGIGDGLLVRTKKSQNKSQPEYRISESRLLPPHIKYILLAPARGKIVIGFDCILNYDEIEQRIKTSTFLEHTSMFMENLEHETESVSGQQVRSEFKNGRWTYGTKNVRFKKHKLLDNSQETVFTGSKYSVEIDTRLLKTKKEIVLGILDAIYDEMLFYTRSLPNEKISSALTDIERELITAINNIYKFYNIFASLAVHREGTSKSPVRVPTTEEWVIEQLRKTRGKNPYQKLLHVLRKIVHLAQDDVRMITQDNEENAENYRSLIALIKRFERLENTV